MIVTCELVEVYYITNGGKYNLCRDAIYRVCNTTIITDAINKRDKSRLYGQKIFCPYVVFENKLLCSIFACFLRKFIEIIRDYGIYLRSTRCVRNGNRSGRFVGAV
jgi:hypothetical protein